MANAIERRLARLDEIWGGLANEPQIKLVRWIGSDADLQLLKLHLELQPDRDSSPDLFVVISTPFESFHGHADRLSAQIIAEYESSEPALVEEGLLPSWEPPQHGRDPGDFGSLVETVESFIGTYGGAFRFLVLALLPEEVADPVQWKSWLIALCSLDLPPGLRVVVLDHSEHPVIPGIDEDLPGVAQSVDPNLEIDAAVEELARSAGRDGPGQEFTLHFLGITSAAGKGNIDAMRRSARSARGIARAQRWPDQEIAVHAALGAGLLAAGQPTEAAGVFRAAQRLASSLADKRHPAGAKLVVITSMSEGSAHFAGNDFAAAAHSYETTAAFAEAFADHMMALEAWRMAAYCHEREDKRKEAWRCCERALATGELLDDGSRQGTTLSHVGQAMLRLLGDQPDRVRHVEMVDKRMAGLLGASWDEGLHVERTPA